MKLTLSELKKIVRKVISPGSNSEPNPDALKGMVRGIFTTRPDEIGCDECFEQLDRFVEVTLAGKNAAEAMPLVQDHLDRCDDCREEFEALLAALEAAA
jgi:hypothetical protein